MTMENTLSFAEVLQDINSTNVREKLEALETGCGARKIGLFNRQADVVYLTGDELLLVKCDFLTLEEKTLEWLADEEVFNNEFPLYFSTVSYRESPVYALQRVARFYARFFPHPPFTILLLLICNYLISNYEDMAPLWNEQGVTVVTEVTGEADIFPERARLEAKKAEEQEDTEFQRLLEEFCTNGKTPLRKMGRLKNCNA